MLTNAHRILVLMEEFAKTESINSFVSVHLDMEVNEYFILNFEFRI